MSELRVPERKPPRRLFLGGALTAVLAGGAAVAVALTVLPASRPASVPEGPSASDDSSTSVPIRLVAAADVLKRASKAAAAEPELRAEPGQYLYFESKSRQDGRGVVHRKTWFSVDGKKASLLRTTDDAFSDDPVPGQPGWGQIWLCNDWPSTRTDVDNPPDGDPRCHSTTPSYRTDLPTTTDAMYKWLYANSHGGNPPDVQAFVTVGDTMRETYITPKARAALFAAAAKIPGVTVKAQVTDLAGRKGLAVGQTWQGTREELIFDATTYRYLGERTIVDFDSSFDPPGGETPKPAAPWTPPAEMKANFKPGQVTYESAELRTALVDRLTQEP